HTQLARFRVAMTQTGQLSNGGIHHRDRAQTPAALTDSWEWAAERDRVYRLDRLVTFSTSRQAENPVRRAVDRLEVLSRRDLDSLLSEHRRVWDERWKSCEI